jgi:hypothetical protein
MFGMEEISWGQRIFGWETPMYLAKINEQKETNIHNIFSKYRLFFYPVFNLSLGLFLLSSEWLRIKANSLSKMKKFVYLIPSREFKLFGLFFMVLGFQSYSFGGELTEEIFSVFCVTYALNQVLPPLSTSNIRPPKQY